MRNLFILRRNALNRLLVKRYYTADQTFGKAEQYFNFLFLYIPSIILLFPSYVFFF